MTVGQRIKNIRVGLGLTMKEFGEKFEPKASDSNVSRWERDIEKPNNARLKQITELGGVTVEYLLYGEDNELQRLREENKRLREALEFYADKSNWVTYEGTVETVCGEIARKALEE